RFLEYAAHEHPSDFQCVQGCGSSYLSETPGGIQMLNTATGIEQKQAELREALRQADSGLIGAGAGLPRTTGGTPPPGGMMTLSGGTGRAPFFTWSWRWG